ncbi:MAG TPA: DNA polymerase III subunit chi [Rhizomicrobium sp.]|jgi:DNA polymerase-3 subunit chi|nr:DNA polymerase III subunit chi [Rhizomicrobium sp.]
MTEALFYHLERRALEDVLPGLVEKSLERGWRALIRCDSAERAEALDRLLWTYEEASFLPHAQQGDGDPARQPVLITMEEGNANAANILFLVGGAAAPAWDGVAGLARVVLMFDGRDAQTLAAARASWKDAKAAGHDVTYWKETPAGRFEKQG